MSKKNLFLSFLVLEYIAKKGKKMKSTNIIYNLRKITQICKQEKPLQQSADRTTEKPTIYYNH